MSRDARRVLLKAADRWQLSNRTCTRILKVARTVGDLAGAECSPRSMWPRPFTCAAWTGFFDAAPVIDILSVQHEVVPWQRETNARKTALCSRAVGVRMGVVFMEALSASAYSERMELVSCPVNKCVLDARDFWLLARRDNAVWQAPHKAEQHRQEPKRPADKHSYLRDRTLVGRPHQG